MSAKRPAVDVRFRLRITHGDTIAIGPGKVDLLEAIDGAGSLTGAAKNLGMSYRRAWLLVDTMNKCFRTPVVATAAGGVRGGGTMLTELGREVLKRYRHADTVAAKAAQSDIDAMLRMLR